MVGGSSVGGRARLHSTTLPHMIIGSGQSQTLLPCPLHCKHATTSSAESAADPRCCSPWNHPQALVPPAHRNQSRAGNAPLLRVRRACTTWHALATLDAPHAVVGRRPTISARVSDLCASPCIHPCPFQLSCDKEHFRRAQPPSPAPHGRPWFRTPGHAWSDLGRTPRRPLSRSANACRIARAALPRSTWTKTPLNPKP